MKIGAVVRDYLEAVLDLFYPRICAACDAAVPVRKGIFCLDCLAKLPETGFHKVADNPFEEHFWGRIQIEAGTSYLFYIPGGSTEHLLHNIKYNGKKHYAETIGHYFGKQLLDAKRFENLDMIVPIPLHPKKRHKRGFNQSAEFAQGLSHALNIPTSDRWVERVKMTETQTKKSREERVDNIKNAFQVRRPDKFRGKHVLLVDDVMTTGATLEACGEKILEIEGTKLSLATIAMGRL